MMQDIKAAEAINTFPIEGEQIFVLTASQLAELMSQAVEKAVQPLKDRLSDLEEAMDLRALEIAQDRRRMAALEHEEPQPKQLIRAENLRSILVAHGGKMPSKEARRIMDLSESRFSELLATMKDSIGKKPARTNGRQNIIYLKD